MPIEERRKALDKIGEIAKAMQDAGKIKFLGRLVSGCEGYGKSDSSEIEVLEYCMKVRQYMSYEVIPLVLAEQASEIIKKVRASARCRPANRLKADQSRKR
ncbi:MAG: hypothetical protein QG670_384 [Thermoproteota archaeon]|nr:hypothetical protein [Thermoproteota archaeon]